jgi:hypothetical protein
MCQAVEVKANTAEVRAKEMAIGGGHVSDRMETEVLKACLRLRASTPQFGYGEISKPSLGILRSNHG